MIGRESEGSPCPDPQSCRSNPERLPSDHACSGLHDLCHGTAESAAERQLLASLPPGHLIRILMEEHRSIRRDLDALETAAAEWRHASPEEARRLLAIVAKASESLVDAETHHRREEELLFPEMIRRGVVGPPTVMGEEHGRLRALKQEVRTIAQNLLTGGSRTEAELMIVTINQLVFDLRNHIFKENNILYPMALGTIREDAVWKAMKQGSDRIGYFCA